MKDFVVYDCETKNYAQDVDGGWKNVYGHGMSCAATYDSVTDFYTLWGSTDRENLCKFLTGKLVVSFNGIWFDSVLLLGNDRILEDNGITRNDKYWWINADVFVEMWRNILNLDRSNYPNILKEIRKNRFPGGVFNLDAIASNTIGVKKNGDGADAPNLYQRKQYMKLFSYVLQDVRILKKLFLFIKTQKYIVTGNYDIVKFK